MHNGNTMLEVEDAPMQHLELHIINHIHLTFLFEPLPINSEISSAKQHVYSVLSPAGWSLSVLRYNLKF